MCESVRPDTVMKCCDTVTLWVVTSSCIACDAISKLCVHKSSRVLVLSKEEQEEHLKLIMELLKKKELYAKFSKCDFLLSKVQFLGHVIDSKGVHVDPAKIESIKDWASRKTPTEIRQFLGLAGYYRRFIEGFSKIARHMTNLTQKSANVVTDALSQKERVKPIRVRALMMTIDLKLPSQILNAQTEARKEENYATKDLFDMIKKLEPRADGTLCLKN
ncbi:hypothetical protein Tco_0277732 [Tanacetum coccineum]